MEFSWSARKAALNLVKHDVSFEEACTALRDTLSITGADPDHSEGETRWITFGASELGRLLVVAHTEERDTIRIISARIATKAECRIYEES